MTAELDLGAGREPAQAPPLALAHEEGRLGEAVLCGHPLHPRLARPCVHHADRGGVSAEDLVRERVDDVVPHRCPFAACWLRRPLWGRCARRARREPWWCPDFCGLVLSFCDLLPLLRMIGLYQLGFCSRAGLRARRSRGKRPEPNRANWDFVVERHSPEVASGRETQKLSAAGRKSRQGGGRGMRAMGIGALEVAVWVAAMRRPVVS